MYSILIVEDEPLIREGIVALVPFEQLNITKVYQAENGQMALDILQQHAVDILLTDINMPKLDGISLTEQAKKILPQLHVIFLTGYDYFDYAMSAIKLGVDDYVLKPVSKKDIIEMLVKVIKKVDDKYKMQGIQQLLGQQYQSDKTLTTVIDEHLNDSEFSLTTLSQLLGYSASHTGALVKKELGISFQDYMIQRRMDKAKLLLLTTQLKIYEIAQQVGYEDVNYFSTRFKQIVGVTPKKFAQSYHVSGEKK